MLELPLADFLDDNQLVPPHPVGVNLDELTDVHPFKDPQSTDAEERKCFEPLIETWNEVLLTARKQTRREPTLFAIQCPDTPFSGPDDCFNKSSPDAALMLTSLLDAKDDWRSALLLFDAIKRYSCYNVVLPIRFKTKSDDESIADVRLHIRYGINI